ncbi:MAG: type IV pilus biogenesis/stability protein PilW, partial [Rhodanobacter sp.]
MRFDRALMLCLLLPLAGCITTHTNSGTLGKPLPQESRAEQAKDAARVHTELAQHYLTLGDLQTALAKVQM